MENKAPSARNNTRRAWPWLLGAALVLFVVLAVVWVRAEARRIHEQRQPDMPASSEALR